jgi:hypothetical protein
MMDESDARDANVSWQETGTSAQAADVIDRMVSELQREGRLQLAGRLRMVSEVNELLVLRLPGGLMVRVSLDYILQEQVGRGIVDLTGERSYIPGLTDVARIDRVGKGTLD